MNNCCNANFNCALIRQLVSLLVSPSAPCNYSQCKLDLCHITGKHVCMTTMITVQNSNNHLASHTVAPEITGMHDTMFFVAMVWKKKAVEEKEKEEGGKGKETLCPSFLDPPVVTMGISCTVSEKNVNFSQKIANFSHSCVFNA